MKRSILIIGLVLLLLIPIANANVTNLSAEVGSTYIKWTWNYSNSTNTSVYLDGQFVMNTSFTMFTISDLNPRELHQIHLTNDTSNQTIIATNSVKTFYPVAIFYIILTFSIGFLLLTIFIKNEMLAIVLGTITFTFGTLGFYMSYPYYFLILSYLMIGIAVIALLWVLMAGFSLISKRKNVEEEITLL